MSKAWSLEQDALLSQYGHTAWRAEQGFVGGTAEVITQTTDGYLWIGTNDGLTRFDGTKFVALSTVDGEPLRNPEVWSLFPDPDGSLWIGTARDLEHWQGGRLHHFPEENVYFGSVNEILRAQDGHIWIGTSSFGDKPDGPICELQNTSLRCYRRTDGVQAPYCDHFLEDKDGSFWIADADSVFHWDPKTHKALSGGAKLTGVNGVEHISLDRDGSILVALATQEVNLLRDRNGQIEPFVLPGLDTRKISVATTFTDSGGALWLGTISDGIYRVAKKRVEHYSAADGLSDNLVNDIFEDREGNIWVATASGIDRFRDLPVLTISTREGLSTNTAMGIAAARDGTVWVNDSTSLLEFHPDGRLTTFRANSELPGHFINSLMVDSQNRLWVSIDEDLQRLKDGHFTRVRRPNGIETGVVNALVEDHVGDVWAEVSHGHGNELLRISKDAVAEVVTDAQLPFVPIQTMAADPRDGIWVQLWSGNIAHWSHGKAQLFETKRDPTDHLTGITVASDGDVVGAFESGLLLIRGGRSRSLSVAEGLPCARIYAVAEYQEALWLYAECGIMIVPHKQLDAWWDDSTIHLQPRLLDAVDGVRASFGQQFPRAAATPEGRILFVNSTVVQVVDSRALAERAAPVLPVQIEGLLADGIRRPHDPAATLPPLTKEVEIDYTSPSFATPQRVCFQRKLDGFDSEWVLSGNRREAFYTDLRPGSYQFHVRASDCRSPWTADSVVSFRILPKFYQTWWFEMLCLAGAMLFLLFLIRMRIEALNAGLRNRLAARMDERERIARDLHDSLFQDIQGLLLGFDNRANALPEEHPIRGELKELLRQSDRIMTNSRRHVLELRADDVSQRSVAETLREVCADLAQVNGTEYRIVEVGAPMMLHPVVFEEVFHICREALINAFKHSGAKHIEAEICTGKRALSVRIVDDGVGIDERVLAGDGRKGHFGLKGMAERAKKIGAKLTISSKTNIGTEVDLLMSRSVSDGSRRERLP